MSAGWKCATARFCWVGWTGIDTVSAGGNQSRSGRRKSHRRFRERKSHRRSMEMTWEENATAFPTPLGNRRAISTFPQTRTLYDQSGNALRTQYTVTHVFRIKCYLCPRTDQLVSAEASKRDLTIAPRAVAVNHENL